MRKGDMFLLGIDMVKDILILEAAYNDKKGITAGFNRNILNVVNRLIKSDFNPDLFSHIAFYNPSSERIEMHLGALDEMVISSPFLDNPLHVSAGETIHTENSYKFRKDDIVETCRNAGLSLIDAYSDANDWFNIFHFIKE